MWQPAERSAARDAAFLALVFLAALGLVFSALYFTFTGSVNAQATAAIDSRLAELLAVRRMAGLEALLEEVSRRSGKASDATFKYLVVHERRGTIAGNGGGLPVESLYRGSLEATRGRRVESVEDGRPWRATALPLGDSQYLIVARDVLAEERFAGVLRVALFAGAVLSSLLAGAGSYSLARRLTTRVQAAAATCESIVAGSLSQRLPISRAQDDLDTLAGAVNRMLDRMQELTRTRRAVFDSAAHDLRGPLYRLRNRIEAMMRKAPQGSLSGLDEALRDIDGLQRTLVMLLQIARAESGTPLVDIVRFDLAALIRDLVELFEPPARQESLQLLHRATVPVAMQGNRQLVAQLISNLIENAIKYVPAGGTIIASAERDQGMARLVVSDNGPGIPAPDRARAVEPFVRLEASQGAFGSGLGLSLVAAIARLHGARFILEDNEPGLRVIIEFPVEPSSEPTAGR